MKLAFRANLGANWQFSRPSLLLPTNKIGIQSQYRRQSAIFPPFNPFDKKLDWHLEPILTFDWFLQNFLSKIL